MNRNTAAYFYHRLREIIAFETEQECHEFFGGEIEVDESYSGVTFYIGLARDITERKLAEKILLGAKEEAELANRTKSEFLANISHELRTPLNAIIGFSELMKSEILGPITVPRYKEYLSNINESASLLLNIINEVMETSRAEFGSLILHEQNINLPQAIDICLRMVGNAPNRTGSRSAAMWRRSCRNFSPTNA